MDCLCSNNYILNYPNKNAWEERQRGTSSKASCIIETVQKFCIYLLPNYNIIQFLYGKYEIDKLTKRFNYYVTYFTEWFPSIENYFVIVRVKY